MDFYKKENTLNGGITKMTYNTQTENSDSMYSKMKSMVSYIAGTVVVTAGLAGLLGSGCATSTPQTNTFQGLYAMRKVTNAKTGGAIVEATLLERGITNATLSDKVQIANDLANDYLESSKKKTGAERNTDLNTAKSIADYAVTSIANVGDAILAKDKVLVLDTSADVTLQRLVAGSAGQGETLASDFNSYLTAIRLADGNIDAKEVLTKELHSFGSSLEEYLNPKDATTKTTRANELRQVFSQTLESVGDDPEKLHELGLLWNEVFTTSPTSMKYGQEVAKNPVATQGQTQQ